MSTRSIAFAAAVLILAAPHAVPAERWRPIGPGSAEVTLLAFANDGRTAWLVTRGPRAYRSRDLGESWTRLQPLPDPGPSCTNGVDPTHLVVDPRNADRAWLVLCQRIVETRDGGISWTVIHQSPPGTPIEALFVDRAGALYSVAEGTLLRHQRHSAPVSLLPDVSVAHATAGAGSLLWAVSYHHQALLRSADHGAHWDVVDSDQSWDRWIWVVADPALPSRLWVWNEELLRSDDGGLTFTALGSSIDGTSPLTVDPSGSGVLLADSSFSPQRSCLVRSDDAGVTWNQLPDLPVGCGLLTSAAIEPRGSGVALFGSYGTAAIGLYRSDDGGHHWAEVTSEVIGARVESLAVEAGSPDQLRAIAGWTVFERAGGGEDWRRSPLHSVPLVAARDVVSDSSAPGLAWAQTVVGLLRTNDHGESWHPLTTSDGGDLRGDPVMSNVLYECSHRSGMLARSDDGGVTWQELFGLNNCGRIGRIVADPHQPERRALTGMICLGEGHHYCDHYRWTAAESHDGGRRWRQFQVPGTEVAFAYAPGAENVAFLATSVGLYQRPRGRSRWHRVDHLRYLDLAAGRRHLYALVRYPNGKVAARRSSDDGRSWEYLRTGLERERPPHELLVVPGRPDTVYALTSGGVFELVP